MKINSPKGTADVLPAESWKWQAVETIAQVAELYHFSEIRTPIFEHTELFHRGVGETSDVVTKETYTFNDRGDRSITLRPEGTAGVVRAMIESNLLAQEGARQKVYYIGPNFRYERPQSGRLRQHHQFGVEAFGVAEPEQDVECILLQLDFYRRCGLRDLKLRINSLGDVESKAAYREELVKFLRPKESELSEDSRRRLETNPLRILDSKDPRDKAACANVAPAFSYLSGKSHNHLNDVRSSLEQQQIEYVLDGSLVRGFDYYTETLWEVSAPGLGSQDAVGGGGRYDNLVAELGGRPTPAVGFGSGLRRLHLALEAQHVQLPDPRKPLIWVITHGQPAIIFGRGLLSQLRRHGLNCDTDFSARSLKAQFKLADRESAAICVVVGDDELRLRQLKIKNMKTGEQTSVVENYDNVIISICNMLATLSPQSSVLSPIPTQLLPSSPAKSPPQS